MRILVLEQEESIEKKLVKELRRHFIDYEDGIEVKGRTKDFEKIFKEKRIDLLLVDVDLNENLKGVSIAKRIKHQYPLSEVVFMSYNRDAIHETLDITSLFFLDKNNFAQGVVKLLKAIDRLITNNSKYVCITSYGRKYVLNQHEIVSVKIDEHDLYVQTLDQMINYTTTLKAFLESVQSPSIVRISRNTAVNLRFVKSFGREDIELKTGEVYKVSKNYNEQTYNELLCLVNRMQI